MHAAARTIARRCARRACASGAAVRPFAVRATTRATRTRGANATSRDAMTSRQRATDDDANDACDATQAVPQGAGGATSNADEYAKIRAAHANVTVREKRGWGIERDARRGTGEDDAGGRLEEDD